MSTQSSVLNKLALCNQEDAQAEHQEEREDGAKRFIVIRITLPYNDIFNKNHRRCCI